MTVCPKHLEEIVRRVVREELEVFLRDLRRELKEKVL